MSSKITKDKYIDNVIALIRKNGIDLSTIIRKNPIEDSSDLGFHTITRYEITIFEHTTRDIYKLGKNGNNYNTGKKEIINIPKDKVMFTSRLKYALYLTELLKESQAKRE